MFGTTPIPPAVCILPMSAQVEFEGWTTPQVQTEFFLGQRARTEDDYNLLHPAHPGRYQYKRHALNAGPGTLVLFQFDAHIIASAVLSWIQKYEQPQGEYHGIMWFEPSSIRVFAPLTLVDVQSVWPEVTQFGMMMWTPAPASSYLRFCRLLRGIAAPVLTAPTGDRPF
jgi:hypothetical protein